MKTWQLLLEGPCPSEHNMPRDAQIYADVAAGRLAGCLRIYNWSTPALTLGYNQKNYGPVPAGLPCYVRPTGGGAVLHCDDLTYAVAAPASGPLGGSLLEAYHAIAAVFAAALRDCGIAAELVERQAAFAPVCFERASVHELSVAGLKVMGAAQHRGRDCLLQQGVLPLRVDAGLLRRVFGVATPVPRGLCEIKPDFELEEFVEALLAAFASELDVRLEPAYS